MCMNIRLYALEVNQYISIDMKNNNLPDIILKNLRYVYLYAYIRVHMNIYMYTYV
jgi:hypothetical protein